MKDSSLYLYEILSHIENVRKFLGNSNEEELAKNHMMCSAIVLQLAMIGELSKRISLQMKREIDLPWNEIAAFRNRAIHEYSHIDKQIVIDVVFNELSSLEKEIKKFLKKNKK